MNHRFTAKLLTAATFALSLATPVGAQPLAQAGGLEPAAPDNLRCPAARTEGRLSLRGPVAERGHLRGPVRQVALDHSCNLFVVDPAANQVVKYNADGQQVGAVNMLAREAGTDDVAGVAVAQVGRCTSLTRACTRSANSRRAARSSRPGRAATARVNRAGWSRLSASRSTAPATRSMSWTNRLTR